MHIHHKNIMETNQFLAQFPSEIGVNTIFGLVPIFRMKLSLILYIAEINLIPGKKQILTFLQNMLIHFKLNKNTLNNGGLLFFDSLA